MIWNSVFLMTLIDFLIIFAVLYSVAIFYKHYRTAKQLGLTVGVNFILSGLVLIALFYLVDLSTMHIYPLFTSKVFAMASMTNLHLNWSWIGILISVSAITIGLSYLVQILIPKTFHTLEILDLTKDNLKKELAARQHAEATAHETLESLERQVKERTTELESLNTKLEQEIVERMETEQALRKSELRYRTIVEDQTELICRTELDGTFSFVNQAYCRYYDKQSDQLIGSKLEPSPILDDDCEMLRKYYDALGPQQALGTIEHRVLLPSGEVRWQQWVDRVLLDEEGCVVEFQSVGRDITERKQAEEALARRAQEMEALYETSLEINSHLEISILLQAIVQRAAELLKTQMGGLFLVQPDGETLRLVVGHNQPEELIGSSLRLGEGLAGRIAQISEPLQIANYRQWEGLASHIGYESIGRILGVPLKQEDQIIGVLNVFDDEEGEFDEDEVRLLSLFAAQAVLAIEKARLIEQVHLRREHLKLLHETETQRRRETETLRNATVALTSALELDQVLDAILTHLEAVVPYDSAGVFLQEGDHLRAVAGRGFPISEDVVGRTYPLEDDVFFPNIQRTGRPLILADAQADPGFVRWASTNYIRGWIGVPLIVSGQVIGFLTLDNREVAAYGEAEAALAQALANQAAIAIENARLFDQVQHYAKELEQRVADRTRELSALYDVTAVATESIDLQTALERSLKQVLEAMRTNIGYIRLLDETGETLRLVAQQGLPPDYLAIVEVVPSNSGLVGKVIESGEPLIVPDITTDPRANRSSFLGPQTAYVGVPIRARGRVLGTLSILKEKEQPQFSMEEITLLTSIADHVGVVVESARLRQLASQAAVLEERGRLARGLHDSVTQLLYSLNLFAEVGRESRQIGDLDQVDNTLKEIGVIAQQALKEMRLLVYELRPATLEQEGLIGALQHRLDAVEGRAGVKARLLLDEVFELERHLEEALYHITQEALNNALKHAEASIVTVRLTLDDKRYITLEVTDNGSGFNSETLNRGGLGLISMQERTEGLGGTFTINSTPGEGTVVMVRVKSEENGKSKGTFSYL